MIEIRNSYEREVDDWAESFMKADARFAFQRAKQLASSNLAFGVAEWKSEA
ncbi:hypothetical protein ANO14919_054380 [Xylariales sp. No.14919]|nr:hypothetical protein ANO14919_054380 [Xylariales sp. No.14919]